MPVGSYATFGQCVGAMRRKGKSRESAQKICGSMEGGSSNQTTNMLEGQMSEQQQQQQQKPPQQDQGITLSQDQASVIASFVTNAMPVLEQAGAPPELLDMGNQALQAIQEIADMATE